MNIQIFGSTKSSDSRKAERYFKERRIKYQFIDMKKYGMSGGELCSGPWAGLRSWWIGNRRILIWISSGTWPISGIRRIGCLRIKH